MRRILVPTLLATVLCAGEAVVPPEAFKDGMKDIPVTAAKDMSLSPKADPDGIPLTGAASAQREAAMDKAREALHTTHDRANQLDARYAKANSMLGQLGTSAQHQAEDLQGIGAHQGVGACGGQGVAQRAGVGHLAVGQVLQRHGDAPAPGLLCRTFIA